VRPLTSGASHVISTSSRWSVSIVGVKLMVDFHNRVNPPFVAARENVQNGTIGTPTYGYARLSNTTLVPLEMLTWADRSSALWFLGSHAVDIMRSS
jgi:predicted dehydrogenase